MECLIREKVADPSKHNPSPKMSFLTNRANLPVNQLFRLLLHPDKSAAVLSTQMYSDLDNSSDLAKEGQQIARV